MVKIVIRLQKPEHKVYNMLWFQNAFREQTEFVTQVLQRRFIRPC